MIFKNTIAKWIIPITENIPHINKQICGDEKYGQKKVYNLFLILIHILFLIM